MADMKKQMTKKALKEFHKTQRSRVALARPMGTKSMELTEKAKRRKEKVKLSKEW